MVNRGAQAASNWMLRRCYSDLKLEVSLFFSEFASYDKENSIMEPVLLLLFRFDCIRLLHLISDNAPPAARAIELRLHAH